MQRYFISQQNIKENMIQVTADDFFHMRKVMRMHRLDQVICIDEHEQVYLCQLESDQEPLLKILKILDENHELDVQVRLIYGLPKLDKFEYVIQKCTELGVSEIVPLLSSRSLIRTDPIRFAKKMPRYEKIVKEACEQSERKKLVHIHAPVTLDLVPTFQADWQLVAYEEASRQGECTHFEACLKQLKAHDVLNIVVGPEGGFEPAEIQFLNQQGYLSCSLGKRILRSETAPIYMMSVISYYRELKENI